RVMPLNHVEHTPKLAFSGEDIGEMLQDCDKVIFFAATLGSEFEMLIRRAQARDMTKALVFDACGSAAIEEVCEQAMSEIQMNYPEFFHLTDRFSPGYGDMGIQCQHELLAIVNAERTIGLTATDTHILVPRKSVTALIGVADRPQTRRFRGCAYCSMFTNCSFRKAGKTCGK
ncbi:MAG: methionine synthase, partial [Butyricicoccus sp.]|nr:methionine synthase [Butyricicoccus sp.]